MLLLIGLIYLYFIKAKINLNFSNKYLNFISIASIGISGYWFLLLYNKYSKIVIYSPQKHLVNLQSFSNKFVDSAYMFLNIISNNYIGRIPYIGDIQFLLILFSISLTFIIFIKGYKKVIFLLTLIPFLLGIIPIISGYGNAWKVYYPILCYITIIFPIITMILFNEYSKKILWGNFKTQTLLTLIISFLLINNYFPQKESLTILFNDEKFRLKMLDLQNDIDDKILVLRGAEPGGDSQSKWKNYYYWSNSFLLGEFDKLYINDNFKLKDVLCKIKLNKIKIIFEPNSVYIGNNHSGEKLYSKFLELLKQNPLIFINLFERNDVYKGNVYKISEKETNNFFLENDCKYSVSKRNETN